MSVLRVRAQLLQMGEATRPFLRLRPFPRSRSLHCGCELRQIHETSYEVIAFTCAMKVELQALEASKPCGTGTLPPKGVLVFRCRRPILRASPIVLLLPVIIWHVLFLKLIVRYRTNVCFVYGTHFGLPRLEHSKKI